ncbi:MAG: gamma-glutamyl-gamma-aminobutyrate hydrolase family protein [Ilumatobacteraceae bacterium]
MRALLVGNVGDGDPGLVGARFEHHGYTFERVDRDHPETWPTLDGAELIVLLGSEWSVYWPDIVEAVEAEAAAIRECVRRDIPIFGICFGSQIAAHALGGRVYQAAHKEIGWYGVDSAHDAIATGPWMQWHSDVVDVPPGAVQLASSDVGPQAWHVGRTFCTQFHPEVTGEVVERWVRGGGAGEAAGVGRDPEQLIADTYRNTDLARPNTDTLVDWFVETFTPNR